MDQQYELIWNFPKKSAAKFNAKRAWQTTINKYSKQRFDNGTKSET